MSWDVFDRYAKRYDAWFRGEPGRTIFPSEVAAVRLLLRRLPPPTLEVGAGTGAFAAALGLTLGVDPASGALRIARARGVPAVQARGEALPFRESVFGAVLLIATLCFAEEPLALLREAVRVLKPKGGVIVADILKDSPWGRFYLQKKAEGHTFYRQATFYTLDELRRMLEEVGLRIVASSSTLVQRPGHNPKPEEALDGIAPGAGFVCLLARQQHDS